MDKALCLDWLKTVWSKRPGGLLRKKSMLVLDAFRCHRMPFIKKKLVEDKTDLVIIPSGMTKMLQPLDVCVNKLVKDALRLLWNMWLLEGDHMLTTDGRMRILTLLDVVEWIAKVWHELDPTIIRKGFMKCSIANAMDGSQADALWNDGDADVPDADESDGDIDDDDLFYIDKDVHGANFEELLRIFNESDRIDTTMSFSVGLETF